MGIPKPAYDHLGKKYKSIQDMLMAYGISAATYNGRKKRNWSLEDILTTPVRKRNIYRVDHKGKKYKNMGEMCKAYNMPETLVRMRLYYGWSLERALTTEKRKDRGRHKICKDHLGKVFNSISEMCTYHGVTLSNYESRIRSGKTLEEALTNKKRFVINCVMDEEGNEYNNITELGLAKNIDFRRAKESVGIEQADDTDIGCVDHEGNRFRSAFDMCCYWGLGYTTYLYRRKRGYSLEKALTKKVKHKKIKNNENNQIGVV